MERATFQPSVFYRDARAALTWLETAFGFETSMLVTTPDGQVGHAEMSFGAGAISIGNEFEGALVGTARARSPASTGGACTQFVRVHLEQGIDQHCARAQAAGARITEAPTDQFYGHRTYRALDLEGHIWTFSQLVAEPSAGKMAAATGFTFHTSSKETSNG